MGQKTHPIGLRLGIVKGWDSKWFADKELCGQLARGPVHQAVPEAPALPSRDLEDPRRAQGGEGHDYDQDGAPRAGHRPQGRAGRPPLGRASQSDQARHPAQHRGGQASRPRCAVGRRAHRQAARTARLVPPSHEEGDRIDDAWPELSERRSRAPADSAAPRWVAGSRTAMVACRFTRCAPTSTSLAPRHTPRTAPVE